MTDPRRLIAAVLAFTLTAVAGRATAQELAPAIVFDMGGKFDKSFNEGAYNGAERFKKETGIAYREFEVTAEAQREQALRNMARRGSQIVVAAWCWRPGPDIRRRSRSTSTPGSSAFPPSASTCIRR